MKLPFTKMHGCGNDYIYFNCFEHEIKTPEALSAKLSDRHFGIGGDGIVLICPPDDPAKADARMRMFNADGSEGKMCGNAIRCVGKYLNEYGITKRDVLNIETRSGIKNLSLTREGEKVISVKVDMGLPELLCKNIPVLSEREKLIDAPVRVGERDYAVTCVSMGNPHCIIFVDSVDRIEIEKTGPLFEKHPMFPEQVNTEFVRAVDEKILEMRVWERGSGETWACGTGACAVAVAAVENGISPKDQDITIKLRGGDLSICYTDEAVWMTGGAEIVFEGIVEI